MNATNKKKVNVHYVNNADFSRAVVEYGENKEKNKKKNLPTPQVTNYIAECFLKICEGLSHSHNFVRYTYRDEMVMDAVENCLKAIDNYDIETATRTGKPNAFAYFTQIAWYAFVRRITKEKRQQDIKLRYLAQSGFDEFMVSENEDPETAAAVRSFVDSLLQRIDETKSRDKKIDEFVKEEKFRKRRAVIVDSDLTDFLS
jgi:DNA-directed RNA polymerase specialized sigma24 family protein